MKRDKGGVFVAVLVGLIILIFGICAGVAITSHKDVNNQASFVQVQDVVVLQYEGINYIVGIIDSTGQQRVLPTEMLSFLILHAKDRGIRKAAEAIGFVGPRQVELKEEPLDASAPF